MIMNKSVLADTNNHPCFYSEANGHFGRIHLPVAPSCNIQCAYCRRDYDCMHESRPGVTNKVISPEQALDHMETALEKQPFISVAGIAGPGDAFSSPELTLKTFELIRKKNSDIALCVSTNGWNTRNYITDLADLNVRFVTVTVNSLDPVIGSVIYKWVDMAGTRRKGIEAAGMLINRQLEAISFLKERGFTVKVNSVVIPGVNEDHLVFLARKMGEMGVDLMNLIPVIPVEGTDMENVKPPEKELMHKLRKTAGGSIPQMRHCTRCRSDAVGMLGS